MGVTSYEVRTPNQPEPGVASVSEIEMYNYPTFNPDERPAVVVTSGARDRQGDKFPELPPNTRGDYFRLGFLVGFPTFFFIVACIILGTA